jgi:hypothetical protein
VFKLSRLWLWITTKTTISSKIYWQINRAMLWTQRQLTPTGNTAITNNRRATSPIPTLSTQLSCLPNLNPLSLHRIKTIWSSSSSNSPIIRSQLNRPHRCKTIILSTYKTSNRWSTRVGSITKERYSRLTRSSSTRYPRNGLEERKRATSRVMSTIQLTQRRCWMDRAMQIIVFWLRTTQ